MMKYLTRDKLRGQVQCRDDYLKVFLHHVCLTGVSLEFNKTTTKPKGILISQVYG